MGQSGQSIKSGTSGLLSDLVYNYFLRNIAYHVSSLMLKIYVCKIKLSNLQGFWEGFFINVKALRCKNY